jgi:hypothetical protein
MDSADAGNLYVSLTNGPTTVTVSSYSLDPHDLDAVGRAAMAGAVQAIVGIDPDLDADVDVPGEPDDDGAAATAAGAPCPCGCGCAIPETPGACPCACCEGQCMHCMGEDDDAMETAIASPAAQLAESGTATLAGLADGITPTSAPETPAAENPTPEGAPAMAEPTTAAETAAAPAVGGVTLTDDQFAAAPRARRRTIVVCGPGRVGARRAGRRGHPGHPGGTGRRGHRDPGPAHRPPRRRRRQGRAPAGNPGARRDQRRPVPQGSRHPRVRDHQRGRQPAGPAGGRTGQAAARVHAGGVVQAHRPRRHRRGLPGPRLNDARTASLNHL